MRRAAKRDDSEPEIVEAFRRAGWSVEHLSIPGGPDLLLGCRGVSRLAEIKTGNGKLKPGQMKWHQSWRGSPVMILRSVRDALEVIAAERVTMAVVPWPLEQR